MFTQKRSLEHFAKTVEGVGVSTLALVAAATVAFVARRDADTLESVGAALHKVVEDKGLKTASVFRYVGLARALAADLDTKAVEHIRDARSPGVATTSVLEWFGREKLTSMDKLAERLGTYQRTPPAQPSERAAAVSSTTNAITDRKRSRATTDQGGSPPQAAIVREVRAEPVVLLRAIAVEIDDADVLADMIDVLEERLIAVQLAERRAVRGHERQRPRAAVDTAPKPPSRGRARPAVAEMSN